MPAVINPTASLMGAARRAEIVEVARRHDIAIVENDALGPLVERRAPPLAAIAPERTLHVTSFTKCVVPGLPTGYLVAPRSEERHVGKERRRRVISRWRPHQSKKKK